MKFEVEGDGWVYPYRTSNMSRLRDIFPGQQEALASAKLADNHDLNVRQNPIVKFDRFIAVL